MLRLHRNAIMTSGNSAMSTTELGSVLSTSMVFNSQLATSSYAMRDIETLTNTELNRERNQFAVEVLLVEGEEEFEMDARR
jgi:hypothetical protein